MIRTVEFWPGYDATCTQGFVETIQIGQCKVWEEIRLNKGEKNFFFWLELPVRV